MHDTASESTNAPTYSGRPQCHQRGTAGWAPSTVCEEGVSPVLPLTSARAGVQTLRGRPLALTNHLAEKVGLRVLMVSRA